VNGQQRAPATLSSVAAAAKAQALSVDKTQKPKEGNDIAGKNVFCQLLWKKIGLRC
jgi:hypothetical protein